LVPITSTVTATFNKPMNQTTINSVTFTVRALPAAAIGGTFAYNAVTNTVTFTPASALANDTIYTVTVTSGVMDLSTVPLALVTPATLPKPNPWTFRTVAAAIPPPAAASCNGPGPLDLGTAAPFAVLAGTAFTLTNPTSVTGDVGSPSITPATGPSTLVGTQFDTATGSLPLIAAAVSDMQTAFGCANTRICDFSYAAATDFATLGVLAPGVHCVSGAMSVGSPLNLSAPGVYIFRATGTLTSASNIQVAFTGTANAANTTVFWVPNGATSIGAGNTFLGTIMSSSGAITMGATSTLIPGRVLSGAAVTLSSNTVTKPTP
jgi:hypothetical protein